MKSMMKKTAFREVRGTFGRFAAILSIIALGVGFFSGVRITTPAMVSMMNDFLTEKQLYDLRLISTLGWEEQDAATFANQPGVRYAEAANSLDVLYKQGGDEMVLKTHSMPQNVNGFRLTEGRLPESANECVADSDAGLSVGDRLSVSAENSNDTRDSLKYDEYIVVGRAESSYYINFERGTTSIGNGSVYGFVYLDPEAFDTDYYSEIFIKFDEDFDIYSDEYNDFIDGLAPFWEDVAAVQADSRYERLIADAEQELADGKAELEEKRADGQRELDDAKKELDEAAEKLSDAKAELDSAAKDIEDGQQELDDAKKELDDGRVELDKAKKQLDDSKKTLDDSEKQLSDGEAQLRDGQAQLDSAAAEIAAGEAELSAQEALLNAQESAFYEQYGQALAMIDVLPADQQEMLREGLGQIDSGRFQIEAVRAELESGRNELEARQSELDSSCQELEAGRREFESGKAQYQQGLSDYNKAKSDYDNGLREYQNGLKKLQDGKNDYEEGLAEYQDGLAEYEDGLAEYQDGLREFDEKIADAEQEIADAEAEIADIDQPDVYVLNRNTNIGYAYFESDSEIVEQVARVFPIFFILVAALVCMTTMSRMVEEQRTQIGMFKALGYSEGAIMGKFMFYSGSAALTGCVLGYAVGTVLFPAVIWITYKLMYIPLTMHYLFDWKLAAVAVGVSLLCSIGTTWVAVRVELSETAAELMRPKAPKAGKRVFLEYVPFLWNRLKFLHKVSIRNIFRYKGRFFMMILGIGGCTALLLTGLGLKDSVAGFADVQYGEVQIADASMSFKPDSDGKMPDKISELLDENAQSYLTFSSGAWDLIYGSRVKSVTVQAFESFDGMGQFMNFRDMDGNALDYPRKGEALVSHSIADRYGAELGEEIVLRDEDMRELHLTVTGIFENHVYNYVFVGAETLEQQRGKAVDYNGAFINFPAGSDIYKVSAEISKVSGVTGITIFEDLKVRMSNMMSSLNYIVLLVIICAAGLAFVVIYNLTNINITERVREIATIKVLGFFRRETSAYVLRENLALTAMGVIVGLGLGVLLHRFVMAQIVVDIVDFSVRILPLSFLLSVVLTFVFNFIVNLFMELKLEHINMAESLKSVD